MSLHAPELRIALVPTAGEGEITGSVLSTLGFDVVVCPDLPTLCDEMRKGVGVALMGDEALDGTGLAQLAALLSDQPSWSDVPVVLLTRVGMDPSAAARSLASHGNVTLLGSPVPQAIVVNTLRSGLRARARQLDVRQELRVREEAAAALRAVEAAAHDFNDLLTGILGNVALARMTTYQDEETDHRLGDAERAGKQAQLLARQLSSYARGDEPVPVRLPLPAPQAPRAPVRARGVGRLLVMDDDAHVRGVAYLSLVRLGYQVTLSTHGFQAIGAYRAARVEGRPYDVVFLDLTVPGGMGGLEALQQLRELDAGVRAVAVCSFMEDALVTTFAEHGFAGVITKPYTVDDLSRVLRAVSSSPGPLANPATG